MVEDSVTEGPAGPDLLPVRMVAQFAYCPRLFYLMHSEGRWDDNVYTEEGKEVHRRLDKLDHVLPDPMSPVEGGSLLEDAVSSDPDRPRVTRSVFLGSEKLGLTGKLDLVATSGTEAVPVETKRGRPPNNPEQSWEPDRVQLMAQGLLLREHGYSCDHGILYYAESKTRVVVPFDETLEKRTLELTQEARAVASGSELPAPLEDSPKCWGCSLSGICLPDETLTLRALSTAGLRSDDGDQPTVRLLYPPRDNALPLYVQEQGARVGKEGSLLTVKRGYDLLTTVRLKDVSQVVLLGNVSITAQAIHLLCEAGIPVVHYSMGHWFYGITFGSTVRNSFNREAQFRKAADPDTCLKLARRIVWAKGANQRTLLLRNTRPRATGPADAMAALLRKVPHASSLDELLGLEGAIAAHYFGSFSQSLKPRDLSTDWDFKSRNRRPPKDPINALLSFAYAILAKDCVVALLAEGLDPWWGFFHKPRHGRPALALDLMEEFRPLIAESAVLAAINTGMVGRGDFLSSQSGCLLTPTGRRAFLKAYEARLDHLVTHPVFGYRCSWRSVIRVQARLLARWIRGDVPHYLPMRTR